MRRLLVIGCVVVAAACINFSARVSDVCATTGSCACVEPGNCCVNPGFSCDDTSACCSGSRCVMGSCVARATGGGSATAGGNAAAGGTATAGGSGGGAASGDWVYEAWWMESIPLSDGGFFANVKRAPFDPDAVHIDEARAQVVYQPDPSRSACPNEFSCGTFRVKGSSTSADVAFGINIAMADTSPPNLAMVVRPDGGLSQQVSLLRAQCGIQGAGLGGVDLLDGQLVVSCGKLLSLNGSVLSTTAGASLKLSFDVACGARSCVVPWQTDSPVSFHRTTFDATTTTPVDFPDMVIADSNPTPTTAAVVLDDGGVFAAWAAYSRGDAGAGVWVESPASDGGLTFFPVIPVALRLSCFDDCLLSWSYGYAAELRQFAGGQWDSRSAGFENVGTLSWAGVVKGKVVVTADSRLPMLGDSVLYANGMLKQTLSGARQLTIVRHR